MPQSQFNETRLWICLAQAKLGPVEDDLGLTAVTNKDLLEAGRFWIQEISEEVGYNADRNSEVLSWEHCALKRLSVRKVGTVATSVDRVEELRFECAVEPKLPTARRLLSHLTIASCGVGLPM